MKAQTGSQTQLTGLSGYSISWTTFFSPKPIRRSAEVVGNQRLKAPPIFSHCWMAAAVEDENSETMMGVSPHPHEANSRTGQVASVTPKPSPKDTPNPRAFIASVASKIASQPLQNYDPHVWGVLTAISNNARKRHQVGSPLNSSSSFFLLQICFSYFSLILYF